MKKVDIDLYLDGYKAKNINCIDIPLASCLGAYNRNYYFYYCLCYCIFYNWHVGFLDNWLESHQKLIGIFDIDFIKTEIYNKKMLHKNIKNLIDNNSPVFFVVKYGSLYYSRYYTSGTYDHGIVISNYDDKLGTYDIRDREIARDYIDNGTFQSDVLFKLQIEKNNMYSIWNKSNKLFKVENSLHHNNMYGFIPKGQDFNLTINDILVKLEFLNGGCLTNQLLEYSRKINERIENNIEIKEAEMENARRIFIKSYDIFQDVIYRYLSGYYNYTKEYNDFIQQRTKLFNIIQKNIITKKLHNYDSDILIDTEMFFTFFEKILNRVNC